MRNSLDELPVLACMLWGGLIAGLVCSLLRLPGKVYARALRGRRAKPLPLAAIAVCDIAAALFAAAAFALTLVHANGGEPRLFALCGFVFGCAVTGGAVKLITGTGS